jgi:hypothetical protein
MMPTALRVSSVVLVSIAIFGGGCGSEDAGVASGSGASTPPSVSAAVSEALSAAPASSVASASAQASSDTCQSDSDCVLLTEDQCCVQTTCDQDRQALTKARAVEKHLLCARMDCQVSKRKDCSVADVRVVAACRGGRCVLLEPGTGGTERIREPRPAK